MSTSKTEQASAKPALNMISTRRLPAWLRDNNLSLAFTTYQTNKIFMVGPHKEADTLSVTERTFPRPMGIGVGNSGEMWVSCLQHMWRFENFFGENDYNEKNDSLFVPVEQRTTGDIDIHDVRVRSDGRPIFVATLFNCIASLDTKYSFREIYRPPFIDRMAAEDRCHLNSVELNEDDEPIYATAVAESNVVDGWKNHRVDGGILIDIKANEIVAKNLSMPHSVRVHNGTVFLINSGTGELGTVDVSSGKFEPLCFLPGFARGMSIIGDHAVIALSDTRETAEDAFKGLPLAERFDDENRPHVGLAIVNLKSGDVEHSLTLTGVIKEIYDCAVVPGVTSPSLLGIKNDATRFAIRYEEPV